MPDNVKSLLDGAVDDATIAVNMMSWAAYRIQMAVNAPVSASNPDQQLVLQRVDAVTKAATEGVVMRESGPIGHSISEALKW